MTAPPNHEGAKAAKAAKIAKREDREAIASGG